MARLANEPAFGKLGEAKTELSPNALYEFNSQARYHEWSNWVLWWTYIPGLVGGLIIPSWPLFWVTFLVSGFNLACIFGDRYKRFLIADMLARGAIGDKELDRPKPPEKPLADWYFAPKRWETEKLYLRTGVERFRVMMVEGTTALMYPPGERERNARYMQKLDRMEMLSFDQTTRIGEMIHTAGFLLHVAMFIAFWHVDPVMIPYFVLLLIYDLYFMFLQRYHRVRIWRLVQRLRKAKARA